MSFKLCSSQIDKLCIISLLLLVLAKPIIAYNVVRFGARPDGRTDSTQAFQKAWASACRSVKPAIVDVPYGRFVVRPVFFSGPCRATVTFRMKGTIIGPSDYRVLARSSVWLMFYNINGLIIHGGTLDARGHSFWSCRRRFGYCYNGAQSISFVSCKNVVVRGLTSLNSQKSHMSIKNSNNVALNYLRLRAPSGSPNTDGMNIQHSTRVSVYNSAIMTGDDCIAIGPGTQNMVINKIVCGPGHGISIGSMGNSLRENGVQNIMVSNVVFSKTTNGVRIKSWARPSNSFVRGITFRNLVMRNVYNPIIIDQKYCPNNQCPHQNSGVKISNVKYINIKGTSKTKEAIMFTCSPTNPCTGIRLENIKLSFGRQKATSSCSYVRGTSRGKIVPRSCF
ncbi:polygalacturonase [Beta vulgaris subsp. vulgaris]|uniref:polygalacturonase n=1 Tax=Beta vulgaris subsp. vulgaris TaxID=3555 RepID=UPI0020369DB7|nr:polygalacturonase [Beta vulgaris subsp. vulgaris]